MESGGQGFSIVEALLFVGLEEVDSGGKEIHKGNFIFDEETLIND